MVGYLTILTTDDISELLHRGFIVDVNLMFIFGSHCSWHSST